MWVIVYTPAPTREYGPVEAAGPFDSSEEAQEFLDRYSITGEGYDSHIVKVQDPNEDEGDA